MTVPADAQPIGERLPSADERAAANQLRRIIASAADSGGQPRLKLADERGAVQEVVLMPELSRLLLELLRHVGSGDAVTLVPVGQMLTTQQAADILNVSRPHLVGLVDQGRIAHVRVGRHRRIKAVDLFAYKNERDARRSTALGELALIDAPSI